MDPLVTGALISGASNILGGIFGRRDAPKTAAKTAEQEMRAKIITGREFGLHPLAAIGAQAGGGYTGNYVGDGLAAAGAAVGDAIARRGEAATASKVAAKEIEFIDAQIAEAQSRTLLNQVNARRDLGGIDPYAPRKENALVSVRLENGDTILIPNPDIYEISPTELATGRTIIEGARVIQKPPKFGAANPAVRGTQRPQNRSDRSY